MTDFDDAPRAARGGARAGARRDASSPRARDARCGTLAPSRRAASASSARDDAPSASGAPSSASSARGRGAARAGARDARSRGGDRATERSPRSPIRARSVGRLDDGAPDPAASRCGSRRASSRDEAGTSSGCASIPTTARSTRSSRRCRRPRSTTRSAYWQGDLARRRRRGRRARRVARAGRPATARAGRPGSSSTYAAANAADRPTKARRRATSSSSSRRDAARGAERTALATYWQRGLARPTATPPREQAARTRCAAAVGAARADELVDAPPAVQPRRRAGTAARRATRRRPSPGSPSPAAVETKADSWTQAPRVALLPDRFVLLGTRRRQDRGRGARRARPLARCSSGPIPTRAGGRAAAPATDGDLVVPDELRWMVDFDRAVAVGHGLRGRPRRREQAARLRPAARRRPAAQRRRGRTGAALSRSSCAHHRSQPQRPRAACRRARRRTTPSATARATARARRRRRELRRSSARARASPASDRAASATGSGSPRRSASTPRSWRSVRGAGGTRRGRGAGACRRALWPATLGYFMETMLRPVFSTTRRRADAPLLHCATSAAAARCPRSASARSPTGSCRRPRSRGSAGSTAARTRPRSSASPARAAPRGATPTGPPWRAGVAHVGARAATRTRRCSTSSACTPRRPSSTRATPRASRTSSTTLNLAGLRTRAVAMRCSDPALDAAGASGCSRARLRGRAAGDPRACVPPRAGRAARRRRRRPAAVGDEPDPRRDGRRAQLPRAGCSTPPRVARRAAPAGRLHRRPPPTALLYLLLRHALHARLPRRGLRAAPSRRRPVDAPSWLRSGASRRSSTSPDGERGSESRWAPLYRSTPAITGRRPATVAEYIAATIARRGRADRACSASSSRRSSCSRERPTARLERVVRRARRPAAPTGSTRGCSGSSTSSSARCAALRATARAHAPGVYLGAYGWLEDVRPKATRARRRCELDGRPRRGLRARRRPAARARPRQRRLRARAVAQPRRHRRGAAQRLPRQRRRRRTPARWRSTSPPSACASRSAMLEGIRDGPEPRRAARLPARARAARPPRARRGRPASSSPCARRSRCAPTSSASTQTAGGRADRGDRGPQRRRRPRARRARAARRAPPRTRSASTLPGRRPDAQRAAIDAEVDRLLDVHDAVADLALAEGVHQAVQGNYDRVAAHARRVHDGQLPARARGRPHADDRRRR